MAGRHLLGLVALKTSRTQNTGGGTYYDGWGAFIRVAGRHLLGLVALKTSRTQNTGGGHLL